MNTANLQLEGLLTAIAGINRTLVANGLLTTEELDHCLAVAEQTALGDDRVAEELSPANRDAVVFPIRVLRLANQHAEPGGIPTFAELARMAGETKEPYDQY